MHRINLLLFSIFLAVVMLAGCSQEKLLTPSSMTGQSGMPASEMFSLVGPSEIVMCIDVSDSISADELTAVVGALKGTLSNTSIVPQNGQVAVSAIVYGDTIAVSVPPTPVTADNLTNIIIPGLDSLLVDRLVGGAGADMAWVLQYAGAMLDVSPVSDKQIFLIGSGSADDPAAVDAVCQELKLYGIMVSTVGVAPDESGAALLKNCTMTTGGLFGADDTGIDLLTDEAFAYMLHVDIDMEPEHMDLLRGADHSVKAMVFRAKDPETYPVSGLDVTIEIVAGPNQGESTTVPTDTLGAVIFTFNGDGGPGTDVLIASALHPGTGTTMLDTVTVTWINTPPVCDAGGPYQATFDVDTAMVQLDASASSDADGDTLMYIWSSDCDEVVFDDVHSAMPVITVTGDCLCVDSIMVEVMVSDGYDSTTCGSAVHLDDQRPPVIVVREEPMVIWPPNHKYKKITPEMLLESAEDACGNPIDLSSAVVIEVRSDEPEDHKGDGKTLEDILVHCPNLVMLRAERMGGSNGRVYSIIYRITAENGVFTDAEAKVIVPHDASDVNAIEDEFGGYTVTPECGESD
jgi:hypothetical protein